MSDFVELRWKRNRGWPWPEVGGAGLTGMFGEDGWCRKCDVPNRPQSGSLVLQRKAMRVEGAWAPYWHWNAICLEKALADEVASRFKVELREVAWHPSSPGEAMQIVIPSVGESWFDPDELRARTIPIHGVAGSTCGECGVWRWMPLPNGGMPPLQITPPLGDDVAIAGSPEWFGSEHNVYRHILVRRELAELLAAASPRDVAKVADS